MYTLEEIRSNYKTLPDSKIEKIALFESKGLRKDVIQVLRDELNERNLDPKLLNWVNAETNSFKPEEALILKRKLSNLTCIKCLEKTEKLYGYEINKMVSFLIFSKETNQQKILCQTCGNKARFNALFTTFLFGWWSTHGILTTPYIIIKDLINLFYFKKISNRIYENLIRENTGYFRLNGTEDKSLVKFLSEFNEKE